MGSIEIVINNAGLAKQANIDAKDDDWMASWNETMMVNLNAAAIISKKAVQHFISRKAFR